MTYLQGVEGIGRIHNRRRQIRSEADIRRLMVPEGDTSGRVNAWMVYLSPNATRTTERSGGMERGRAGGGRNLSVVQWQIDAYCHLDDEQSSEITFDNLVERVVDGLNAIGVLDIDGAIFQTPANIETSGFAVLAGSWLVHYASITVGFRGVTTGTQ